MCVCVLVCLCVCVSVCAGACVLFTLYFVSGAECVLLSLERMPSHIAATGPALHQIEIVGNAGALPTFFFSL